MHFGEKQIKTLQIKATWISYIDCVWLHPGKGWASIETRQTGWSTQPQFQHAHKSLLAKGQESSQALMFLDILNFSPMYHDSSCLFWVNLISIHASFLCFCKPFLDPNSPLASLERREKTFFLEKWLTLADTC